MSVPVAPTRSRHPCHMPGPGRLFGIGDEGTSCVCCLGYSFRSVESIAKSLARRRAQSVACGARKKARRLGLPCCVGPLAPTWQRRDRATQLYVWHRAPAVLAARGGLALPAAAAQPVPDLHKDVWRPCRALDLQKCPCPKEHFGRLGA